MFRNFIKKIVCSITKPILRYNTRNLTDEDVWSRTEESISFKSFGEGSRHDWPWYLEGRKIPGSGLIFEFC